VALVGNISGSIQNNSNIGVSGSVVIANRPDALFPTLGSVGGDVVFFVSGSRGGKGSTAERTVSVFGGDAVVADHLPLEQDLSRSHPMTSHSRAALHRSLAALAGSHLLTRAEQRHYQNLQQAQATSQDRQAQLIMQSQDLI